MAEIDPSPLVVWTEPLLKARQKRYEMRKIKHPARIEEYQEYQHEIYVWRNNHDLLFFFPVPYVHERIIVPFLLVVLLSWNGLECFTYLQLYTMTFVHQKVSLFYDEVH